MAKGKNKRDEAMDGLPTKVALRVQDVLERLGCDPIEGLARIAMRDVVWLGMMTEKELKSPKGRWLALKLCPLDLRLGAFKDLASYCYPKLKNVQMLDENGKAAKPIINIYMPDNGRGLPNAPSAPASAPGDEATEVEAIEVSEVVEEEE